MVTLNLPSPRSQSSALRTGAAERTELARDDALGPSEVVGASARVPPASSSKSPDLVAWAAGDADAAAAASRARRRSPAAAAASVRMARTESVVDGVADVSASSSSSSSAASAAAAAVVVLVACAHQGSERNRRPAHVTNATSTQAPLLLPNQTLVPPRPPLTPIPSTICVALSSEHFAGQTPCLRTARRAGDATEAGAVARARSRAASAPKTAASRARRLSRSWRSARACESGESGRRGGAGGAAGDEAKGEPAHRRTAGEKTVSDRC